MSGSSRYQEGPDSPVPRWTLAGLWDMIPEALNESGTMPEQVQMIDSTVIRAHHLEAGAKGGLKKRVLAAQKVALRPKSTSLPTLTDFLSGLR
jgi:transposase